MLSLSTCPSARHSPRLGKRNAALLKYGACATARCTHFVVLQAVASRLPKAMETSACVSRHRSCRSVCSCRSAKPHTNHMTRSRLPAGQAEASISVRVHTIGRRTQHHVSVSRSRSKSFLHYVSGHTCRLCLGIWQPTCCNCVCSDQSMLCCIPNMHVTALQV